MSKTADGKVHGSTVEVTVEAVMSVFRSRIRTMLDEQGIQEPHPEFDGWYDVQDFVGVLQRIEEDTGENALRQIGESVPSHVEWPSSADSPADALAALPDVYEAEHQPSRGRVEMAGDDYARVTEVGDRCRDDGADACVYDANW